MRAMLLSVMVILAGCTSSVPAGIQDADEATRAGDSSGGASDETTPDVGWSLDTLDHGVVTLAEMEDGPGLLQFMASWCSTCRREMPTLVDQYAVHGDAVRFLSVDADTREPEHRARAWVAEFGQEWPLGIDRTGEVTVHHRVRATGHLLVWNASGEVLLNAVGPTHQQIVDAVETAAASAPE